MKVLRDQQTDIDVLHFEDAYDYLDIAAYCKEFLIDIECDELNEPHSCTVYMNDDNDIVISGDEDLKYYRVVDMILIKK